MPLALMGGSALLSGYIGVIENPFSREVNCVYAATVLSVVEQDLGRTALDRLLETLLDKHLDIAWEKDRLERYLRSEHAWIDSFLNRVIFELGQEMLGADNFYFRVGKLAIRPKRFQYTVARLFTIKRLYQLVDFANRNMNSVVAVKVHDRTRLKNTIILKRWSSNDYKRKILQRLGREDLLRQWMRDECDITRGILQAIPTMFNKPPAEMVEEALCEGYGDAYCLYHLRWEAESPLELLRHGIKRCATLDYHWDMKAKIRSMEAIIQDKTSELTQANYQLQRANERLRQMQKSLVAQERMLTESHIAGGMAHEIKNALGAAKLRLESALDQNRLDQSDAGLMNLLNTIREMNDIPDNRLAAAVRDGRDLNENLRTIRKALREIDAAVERGVAITNRVMAYSRLHLDRGSEAVNLVEIIKSLDRTYADSLSRSGITLETFMEDTPLMVTGLEHHFFSIFQNVLLNARDAVMEKQTPDGRIRVYARKSTTEVMVKISDNGIGIPPEHMGQVFYPFFSTRPGNGMGLGLSECQKLLSQYNGTIDIESRQHQGTIVTIRVLIPPVTAGAGEV